ncbi:MAG: alpha-L-arabinofuranosidase C-terminal domain-containing protein, partial [Bacteroidota bacterium]|nr:alpha-L-arabinofuranosidase C-terminal domain-containing protein [Bacteroidota bacterium]
MKTQLTLFIAFFLAILSSLFAQPKLTIDLSKQGAKISPMHYGVFFEDINHAADGGLYAELIRNRSFEDATTPDYWTLTTTNGTATATIETANLLNSAQTKALKLNVSSTTSTTKAQLANTGFWGINLVKGTQYTLSFYAKRDAAFSGLITATLESTTGVQYAQTEINVTGTDWQKYTCTLTAAGNDPAARFSIIMNSAGTLWLDVVSLFPPTFNNRENGLRPDLAQLLVDLKPKFMRFPGGCFIEGDYLANRFQWKNTIGKIEERPGHSNLWGYRTSDGMGYHEFLQLCEDLGAAPLYVVNVGLAHNDYQPYTSLSGYIQDALDAIEYANGPVTSTYGAMRAANGHPEPFNIKYIEIGNENYFGNNYGNRYILFYNAIKAKYPDIQCIGNVAAWGTDNPSWTFTYPVDLVDEHYYRNPKWFINQYNKYDTYSRTGPKVYAGEYAVTSDCGLGNLSAAIGEAVYMAGMERNSDIVPMNSYAPIFVNVNDRKWSPDMIDYNASNVYCTPSYYVQKMFANNIGTVNVAVNDSLCQNYNIITGKVGLGTWSTVSDYSNVTVQNGAGTTLFSDQFANSANWTPTSGTWSVSNGIYSQTATSTD